MAAELADYPLEFGSIDMGCPNRQTVSMDDCSRVSNS